MMIVFMQSLKIILFSIGEKIHKYIINIKIKSDLQTQ